MTNNLYFQSTQKYKRKETLDTEHNAVSAVKILTRTVEVPDPWYIWLSTNLSLYESPSFPLHLQKMAGAKSRRSLWDLLGHRDRGNKCLWARHILLAKILDYNASFVCAQDNASALFHCRESQNLVIGRSMWSQTNPWMDSEMCCPEWSSLRRPMRVNTIRGLCDTSTSTPNQTGCYHKARIIS